MLAAVRRIRNRAEIPVSTVRVPTLVTPVFTAIVIVLDAVLITEKSNPRLVPAQLIKVFKVVPVGMVNVKAVPEVTTICP